MEIVYLRSGLSQKEYKEMMELSDFIVLPYDPISYCRRTSGILMEAVVAGKTPFVQAGSWLAYELQKNDLPELLVNWEDGDIFEKMLQLSQDEGIEGKLKTLRKKYLSFHSVENYSAKLQKLLAD